MKIEIAVFDGFDELDAVGPYEILRNAASRVDGAEVELVGAFGPGAVVAGHGMRLTCETRLTGTADVVLVPGGGFDAHVRGDDRVYGRDALPARLAELHAGGATLASVCTGAMLLANAGLLDGRVATTHPSARDALARAGVTVDPGARVVDTGDVLTAGGVLCGLDLALHLVEREWGARLAADAAERIEYERRGPIRVVSPAG